MGSLINPTCVAREGMRYYIKDPASYLTLWLVNKPLIMAAVGEWISMTVAAEKQKRLQWGHEPLRTSRAAEDKMGDLG